MAGRRWHAQRCIELAGNPILAGYTASKLPWTRKHRPEAYRDLATILLPHDYINFWLTGERCMEYGDASGTGWLDVRTRHWSPELLAAIDPQRDLGACLPPLVELGTTLRASRRRSPTNWACRTTCAWRSAAATT